MKESQPVEKNNFNVSNGRNSPKVSGNSSAEKIEIQPMIPKVDRSKKPLEKFSNNETKKEVENKDIMNKKKYNNFV